MTDSSQKSTVQIDLSDAVKQVFLRMKRDLDILYGMTPHRVEGFMFYEDGIYLFKSSGGEEGKWEKGYDWDVIARYWAAISSEVVRGRKG